MDIRIWGYTEKGIRGGRLPTAEYLNFPAENLAYLILNEYRDQNFPNCIRVVLDIALDPKEK